ncbi:hypothetical protein [Mucilaginibacter sp.]
MCTRNKIFNKLLRFIFTAVMVMSPAILFAQDESCQGQDPTGNNTTCPLDTWVWMLVAAAAILGAVKLYAHKKNKINTAEV